MAVVLLRSGVGALLALAIGIPNSFAQTKALTGQSGVFKLAVTTTVKYGANGMYNSKTLSAGTYVCGDQLFGDPIWGVPKACYTTGTSEPTKPDAAPVPAPGAPTVTVLTPLTGQSGWFKLTSAATIAYGSGVLMVHKALGIGTHLCGDHLFGDPAPGKPKACYTVATSAAPATPAPPPPTPPTTPVAPPVVAKPTPVDPQVGVLPVSGDVMFNGAVSNAEYQAMAQKMGTDAGIAYRYGPSSADYGTASQAGLPSYAKRPSLSMGMVSIQNPNGQGNRGCGWNGYCGKWQIGGDLEYAPGDYSSTILNVGYIADASPDASFYPKNYAAGVGSLQVLNVAHNVMAVEPEVSWTRYDGPARDGGTIDAGIETYQRSFKLDKPVALGKCYGRGGWCTNTLAVYADGRIVSVGSNTASTLVSTKLPEGKVPTAITVTNSGEFALVTVWDTAAMRGQIAVLALGDGCQHCTMATESSGWDSNWGNWKRSYPGLPGLGNYNFIKLIGFVDLPDKLKAPTEISASTGLSNWDYQTVRRYWDTDLDDPRVRARYFSGDLANAYARTGMAVVISKSEKRAAFVDLRPLFAYYKQQYFGQSQSAFGAMIANRGHGVSQWPYTFEVAPMQAPSVIKVVDLPNRPTAVKVGLMAPFRAFVATQEGTLRVFDLGTGYLNQGSGGTPSDIAERFTVAVGRNPTSISYIKERPQFPVTALKDVYPNTPEKEVIVTSRGDRKLQWVRFDAGFTNGSVARTLQESRIVDPISTEDADTHGTESYVLSVADYGGKGIHNFLYGPILWHTYAASKACATAKGGCKLLNNAPFEYGGTFKLPGKPFHAMGANIN